jgi:hypothetical protein
LKLAWEISSQDPISKKNLKKSTHKKEAGGMAQKVKCLSSKYEALSSNPHTAKREKKIALWPGSSGNLGD